ncbi:MAG TPA: squalene--hopene cyclase [Acidimicrobiales bacterium]|nr:squalene--hopene cyclase [Acidimicrobiales bacterium]
MTEPVPTRTPRTGVAEAVERATSWLLDHQEQEGWWKGELETNVTMDAEDLLLREFLDIRSDRDTADAARWIRNQQRDDGTWATFFDGPGDLSTTIEAYVALRLAGDDPDDPHMAKAATFVREGGGVAGSRVFTRIWLALFGEWSWDDLPVLPPEIMYLPSWFPLNIYDFGCWARQTIVPLTIVGASRPARPLAFSLDELHPPGGPPAAARPPLVSWGRFFEGLDKVLHVYERLPIGWVRRPAEARARSWIVERQEADGCWGGIQPPWVYSIIALHLSGYPLDHPVMKAAIDGLERFVVRDDRGRRLEACQSPVWDTALAVTALGDAGVTAEHPALQRATQWLTSEEIRVAGDWAVRRPGLAPSGWAFEFDNDNYADTDDTAEVILALHRSAGDDPAARAAVERGLVWLEGMQSSDGGWGAFDADNTRSLCRELPFCDFGELIDPPSADVTAHVVEMLAVLGRRGEVLDGGVAWLLANQERDGSWFGRWGANHVYGTGAVVPALIAAGLAADHPAVVAAVAWLEHRQQPDGGWGEDLRSYGDPAWIGRGESTPSQTAWALLALLAAGRERDESTERGVAYLVDTQRPDGTWDEPWFTGTGFPGDFYLRYHLYRHVFPLAALGRLRRLAAEAER